MTGAGQIPAPRHGACHRPDIPCRIGGPTSWLTPNGFNLTLALGTSRDENPASARKDFAHAKLGYITDKHVVSADFGRGDDFALGGDQSRNYGVAYVYAAQTWLNFYA